MRDIEQETAEDSQAKLEALNGDIDALKNNPKDVRFSYLSKMLDEWFGEPRTSGSHRIYKTPWKGDPRLNIQNDKGKAKTYQVRQAIKALEKLTDEEKGSV